MKGRFLLSMGALPIARVSSDEPVTSAEDGSSAGQTGGVPMSTRDADGSSEVRRYEPRCTAEAAMRETACPRTWSEPP